MILWSCLARLTVKAHDKKGVLGGASPGQLGGLLVLALLARALP